MPERAYADIVGNFRRGAAGARAAQGDYEGAASWSADDPALMASYGELGDRRRTREREEEALSARRSYAGALQSGDYRGAGAIAAKAGDVESSNAATERARTEVYRGAQRLLSELEAVDAQQGQGYESLQQRYQQAIQQNPNMDPEFRELGEFMLAQPWSPQVTQSLRQRVNNLRDQLLTPEQAATLSISRERQANEGWDLDAYGRPYQNRGGIINRRDEQGNVVRDTAPVPMPRDRVPARTTFGEEGLSIDAVRAEQSLADDWRPVYQNFSEIRSEFGRIQTMANRQDSAGDLALVVSFTKMLDPGSVAREGEVNLTQSAASVLAQVQNLIPRWQEGRTLLPPQTRQALLGAAREMFGIYENSYHELASDYEARTTSYGLNPSRTMLGYRPREGQTESGDEPQRPPNVPPNYVLLRDENGNPTGWGPP